jgi:TorA maturation chaperone TorD
MPTPSERPSADETALDRALARAVLYRALAGALRRPDAEEQRRLFSPSGRSALVAAASLLDADGHAAEALRPLVEEWTRLGAGGGERLREAHGRLFGHSRGLVCAYETEYGAVTGFEQPQALADIAGSYHAFGLTAGGGRDERVDHVACECEFLCFLAQKEAFAIGVGIPGQDAGLDGWDSAEQLELVRAAERGFLRRHLGRFGRAFALLLRGEEPGRFFGALGSVLFAFLTQECGRLGVMAGPAVLELRAPAPDDAPLACGAAGGCPGPGDPVRPRRAAP